MKIFQFTTPEEFFNQLGEAFEETSITPTILPKTVVPSLIFHMVATESVHFRKVAYMDYKLQSVPMSEIIEIVELARQQGVKELC